MPYKIREISRGTYDDRGYSNEESMAALLMNEASRSQINATLTYTFGYDDDRFPLTFLTEGQGSIGVVDVPEIEWTWDVMGRMKFNDRIIYSAFGDDDTPGKGGAPFEVEFATAWLLSQHTLIAPDSDTIVRVMKKIGPGPHGGHLYRLQIVNPNPEAYVDPDMLAVGKYWSLGVPTVSASFSKGNESHVMGPGKMKGQLGYHRFTKTIAGNISNTVVKYEFKTEGGGTTNLWINEEMRQFNIEKRVKEEEHLWISKYNRNPDGTISMLDEDNGQPIPYTAGMAEICRESNYDTYGEYLPLNKIERSIGEVLNIGTGNNVDREEIVLMAGKGFMRDFDEGIRNDARSEGFATPLGDKMIDKIDGGLSYGNYFRQYKTIDNKIITVKHLAMLDNGTIAENERMNGIVHPRTGLPMSSHQAYLIDFSAYDGVPNVRKVRQKGQIYLQGVYKGLTPIPASWGAVANNVLSTTVDMSSLEIKTTSGLQVNNASKMMHIKCVL